MNVKEIKQNQTKKILQFSIPAIIAMVLTSLITVADGFFMGMYAGEAGIAAVIWDCRLCICIWEWD